MVARARRSIFRAAITPLICAPFIACAFTERDDVAHDRSDAAAPRVSHVASALTPEECAARYASAGFPSVYQSDPLSCGPGICAESFAEFCSQPNREGVGVRLCTAAQPCVDVNGQVSGGTPAPCPCSPPDGGTDSGLPVIDAGTCSGPPTYPAPVVTETPRNGPGFDLPEPAASWACGQLFSIPYLGQVLFSPTGGIGFTVDGQETYRDEWKATCRHERTRSIGTGVTINVCTLRAEGRMDETKKTVDSHCVNCTAPSAATCGDIACTEQTDSLTRQGALSRTFAIPLTGGGNDNQQCDANPAPTSRWLDWIKRHVNLSATLGGGVSGTTSDTNRTPGTATCATCTECQTHRDRNTVFLQASGTASMSTPVFAGLSGTAFVTLAGRAGLGREDQTSTCSEACGGYNASVLATIRFGISAGAFGYSYSTSVGYTCEWRNSWSSCSDAETDVYSCRWASDTDP